MPNPIAIAVVENEGRFLIGQRPRGVPLAGYWEFPGGKIQPGETPQQAAVRECLEETSLTVEPLFEYPPNTESYDHATVELHFIACRPQTPNQPPLPPFLWVERDRLKEYQFPTGNAPLICVLTQPLALRRK